MIIFINVYLSSMYQINPTEMHEMYVGALEMSKYDSAELQEVHTLRDKAQITMDARYSVTIYSISLRNDSINRDNFRGCIIMHFLFMNKYITELHFTSYGYYFKVLK